MALRDSGASLSVLSERVPVARLKGGVRGLSPVLSLTAGVTDPEGAWGLISRLQLLWAATKSRGEAYHNSGMHGNTT